MVDDPTKEKKVHLRNDFRGQPGGRSRCRYSSRPSRRVILLPLSEFKQIDVARQCSECAAKAATL